MTEFDYRSEAANMAEVRANVLPRFGDRVSLPEPAMDLCTKEVLVMERLPVRLYDVFNLPMRQLFGCMQCRVDVNLCLGHGRWDGR